MKGAQPVSNDWTHSEAGFGRRSDTMSVKREMEKREEFVCPDEDNRQFVTIRSASFGGSAHWWEDAFVGERRLAARFRAAGARAKCTRTTAFGIPERVGDSCPVGNLGMRGMCLTLTCRPPYIGERLALVIDVPGFMPFDIIGNVIWADDGPKGTSVCGVQFVNYDLRVWRILAAFHSESTDSTTVAVPSDRASL
jgi:hypothetical protein